MSGGNYQVILCERGIRTFETYTRNTMDVSAIALAKRLSHLPVVADPSHAGGHWRLVRPLSLAALAAGADGLLIEVHPDPARALCDGPQSLTPEHFRELMGEVEVMAGLTGKKLWRGGEENDG
jgi:3-deoxy-7-phosphoheptulonate synthase